METVIEGHRQFSAILSVRLTSTERPVEEAQGGVRIVDSEDDDGVEEEMDEEEEADQY